MGGVLVRIMNILINEVRFVFAINRDGGRKLRLRADLNFAKVSGCAPGKCYLN